MTQFITLDGIDGSGKSSIIKGLAKSLKSMGYTVKTAHEPGTTPAGLEIRKLLKSGTPISPVSELLLFQASRADMMETEIKPAIDNNDYDFILLDRFVHSTIAYQGYGNGHSLNVINILNKIATVNIQPDHSILIDVTLDQSRSRIGTRNSADVDKFDNDIEYATKVYNGYQEMVKSGMLHPVKNNTIDTAVSEIIGIIL